VHYRHRRECKVRQPDMFAHQTMQTELGHNRCMRTGSDVKSARRLHVPSRPGGKNPLTTLISCTSEFAYTAGSRIACCC
jgi:hypothetical protein